MTPEEIYRIWAPPDSVWSAWVIPVPFAQLFCRDSMTPQESPVYHLDWLGAENSRELAIVVDLPGANAIHYGLALISRSFRPVPVLDGSPGPFSVPAPTPYSPSFMAGTQKSLSIVDMNGLLVSLCHGASQLRSAFLEPGAPPAFLLDANRMVGVPSESGEVFDNRWMVFPQDMPSGRFLRERGIRKVVLVHNRFFSQPQEDLAHVLLRWQEEGIAVESKPALSGQLPVAIEVNRPSRFRAAWYRGLAILGLRRNDAGGFGGYPSATSGGG
jgi:hypothetical protein